jgi:hypothetical protein
MGVKHSFHLRLADLVRICACGCEDEDYLLPLLGSRGFLPSRSEPTSDLHV